MLKKYLDVQKIILDHLKKFSSVGKIFRCIENNFKSFEKSNGVKKIFRCIGNNLKNLMVLKKYLDV